MHIQSILGFAVGATAIVIGLAACDGNVSGSYQTPHVTIDSGGTDIKFDIGTPPANPTLYYQHKDASGMPIGAPGASTGNSGSIPKPEGSASLDYSTTEPFPPSGGNDLQQQPGPGVQLGRTNAMVKPRIFRMGCVPLDYSADSAHFSASLSILASKASEASQLGKSVLTSGPMLPVPSSVTVDAFTTLETNRGMVVLVSSLPEAFEEYVVTLDGNVIADMSIGLNASLSVSAGGWIEVTSAFSPSLAVPGQKLQLRQRGASHEADSSFEIDL